MSIGETSKPPPSETRTESASPRFWIAVHGVAWGVVLILLVGVVPKIEAIFTDFGIPLPRLTVNLLWAYRSRVLLASAVLALLVADGVVLSRLARRGDVELFRLLARSMLISAVIVILLILTALVLPLTTAHTRLSG